MGVKLAWAGLAIILALGKFVGGLEVVGDVALVVGATLIILDK